MGKRVRTDGAPVVQAFPPVNQTLQVGRDSGFSVNFSFDIPHRVGGARVNCNGAEALDGRRQRDKNLHQVADVLILS